MNILFGPLSVYQADGDLGNGIAPVKFRRIQIPNTVDTPMNMDESFRFEGIVQPVSAWGTRDIHTGFTVPLRPGIIGRNEIGLTLAAGLSGHRSGTAVQAIESVVCCHQHSNQADHVDLEIIPGIQHYRCGFARQDGSVDSEKRSYIGNLLIHFKRGDEGIDHAILGYSRKLGAGRLPQFKY